MSNINISAEQSQQFLQLLLQRVESLEGELLHSKVIIAIQKRQNDELKKQLEDLDRPVVEEDDDIWEEDNLGDNREEDDEIWEEDNLGDNREDNLGDNREDNLGDNREEDDDIWEEDNLGDNREEDDDIWEDENDDIWEDENDDIWEGYADTVYDDASDSDSSCYADDSYFVDYNDDDELEFHEEQAVMHYYAGMGKCPPYWDPVLKKPRKDYLTGTNML